MRKRPVYPTVPMIHRMQALRRAGLSVQAVRAVVELDYGAAPCAESVRKYTSGWSPLAIGFVNPGGMAGLSSGPNRGRAA
jgi:hypothetical protein